MKLMSGKTKKKTLIFIHAHVSCYVRTYGCALACEFYWPTLLL